MPPSEQSRLRQDFAEVVPEAEKMVLGFTGLSPGQYPSRPWVMGRNAWVQANLRGFEGLLEPLAERVLASRQNGSFTAVRRAILGAQLGALLGYLARRVLGQFDLFLPPDDEGLLYFVGPNIADVERKFDFPQRDFRLWISLHEVTHRVQFGGAPWLRRYMTGLIDSYLASVQIDPAWLMNALRRAVEELASGRAEYRGLGWIFLLMTPEQRDVLRKVQAAMALIEGHGNFVMDSVAETRIPQARVFRQRLRERRRKAGVEKAFQRAIGFDTKVRQYDLGERFVARVVDRVGMDGFNRVWDRPSNFPTLEEVGKPDAWVARVAIP